MTFKGKTVRIDPLNRKKLTFTAVLAIAMIELLFSFFVKKFEGDYLCLAIVIFLSMGKRNEAEKIVKEKRKLLNLKSDYEFHYSRNSVLVKKEFSKTIKSLDYKSYIVKIKKTTNKKDASYKILAQQMIKKLEKDYHELKIFMDDNPILFKELKIASKDSSAKYSIKQIKSKNCDLIQVADYIVSEKLHKIKKSSFEDPRDNLHKRYLTPSR